MPQGAGSLDSLWIQYKVSLGHSICIKICVFTTRAMDSFVTGAM